jgi:hypothetical protein
MEYLTTRRSVTKIITPISLKNVLCLQNGRINKKKNQMPEFFKIRGGPKLLLFYNRGTKIAQNKIGDTNCAFFKIEGPKCRK